MDYESSLDRALDAVPELGVGEDRLKVPDATTHRDGAFTRLTNIGDIADALARDVQHLHSSVQRELGTAGQIGEEYARYNGNFSEQDFDAAIEAYIAEYVTCSECGLPDTRLVNEKGTTMLRCEACGAFRPVSSGARRKSSQQRKPEVKEGGTYEVTITGTGRKGDGVAERGKYTIFVPGASKGQTVQIYIESVAGSLAFARLA